MLVSLCSEIAEIRMPQYFFHVTDGHSTYRDENGSLHLSFADAYAEASRIAGELARDGAGPGFMVCMVEHDGNEVACVPIDGIAH
jgi:hypothetical protein